MSGDQKDFTLELDDDVLAAAMASVDKHLGHVRKKRAYDLTDDSPPPPGTAIIGDGAADLGDVEVEVELEDAGLELLVEEPAADDELEVQVEPSDELVNEEALALLERSEHLEKLSERQAEEIEMLRSTLARQQADLKEQKERAVRLNVRGKRLHQQHEQLRLRHEDAQAKISEWEVQLHELREAVRNGERERSLRATRFAKETEEARLQSTERAMRELLPALDNLDLALAHADDTPADQMVEGVRMILRQLEQSFSRLGMERIDSSAGTPFDPTCHEAIKHVPSDEQAPGTILITHQVGWVLHDRLLRAARVEVADAPQDESPVQADQEAEAPPGPPAAEE